MQQLNSSSAAPKAAKKTSRNLSVDVELFGIIAGMIHNVTTRKGVVIPYSYTDEREERINEICEELMEAHKLSGKLFMEIRALCRESGGFGKVRSVLEQTTPHRKRLKLQEWKGGLHN